MGKRYDQLDLDDRIEISRLHAAGKSRREIGHTMGRNASTISREPRRNSLPRGEREPASADRMALSRRRQAQAGRIRTRDQPRVDLPLHLPPKSPQGEAPPLPGAGQGNTRTAHLHAQARTYPRPPLHPRATTSRRSASGIRPLGGRPPAVPHPARQPLDADRARHASHLGRPFEDQDSLRPLTGSCGLSSGACPSSRAAPSPSTMDPNSPNTRTSRRRWI